MAEYYSSVAMVMTGFLKLFKDEFTGLSVVYEPEVTFTEAVRRNREIKLLRGNYTKKDLPMLVWNRQALKIDENRGEHSGRRNVRRQCKESKDHLDILASMSGAIDVEFLFVANNLRDIEYFEVLSTVLMHNTLTYECDLGELGTRGVQIYWEYPTTLSVTHQDAFYIGLSATARLVSEYFIFDNRHPRLYEIWHNVHMSVYNNDEMETIKLPNISEE